VVRSWLPCRERGTPWRTISRRTLDSFMASISQS